MSTDRLHALLSRGCGIPAARDHAKLMLRIAERTPPEIRQVNHYREHRRTDWVLTCLVTAAIAATFLWLGCAIGGRL